MNVQDIKRFHTPVSDLMPEGQKAEFHAHTNTSTMDGNAVTVEDSG